MYPNKMEVMSNPPIVFKAVICVNATRTLGYTTEPSFRFKSLIILYIALADPEGGCGGCNPPLNFQKRRVNSVAVVISTVSTVSEQERNGQGRRDVGKSVHVRQAIMQLDAYHVRRGFV